MRFSTALMPQHQHADLLAHLEGRFASGAPAGAVHAGGARSSAATQPAPPPARARSWRCRDAVEEYLVARCHGTAPEPEPGTLAAQAEAALLQQVAPPVLPGTAVHEELRDNVRILPIGCAGCVLPPALRRHEHERSSPCLLAPWDSQWAGLLYQDVGLQSTLWARRQANSEQSRHAVLWGARRLDRVLGNGVFEACVTEFAGESASGKTQLCHVLAARTAARSEGVLWLDTTNSFDARRLRQVLAQPCQEVHPPTVRLRRRPASSLPPPPATPHSRLHRPLWLSTPHRQPQEDGGARRPRPMAATGARCPKACVFTWLRPPPSAGAGRAVRVREPSAPAHGAPAAGHLGRAGVPALKHAPAQPAHSGGDRPRCARCSLLCRAGLAPLNGAKEQRCLQTSRSAHATSKARVQRRCALLRCRLLHRRCAPWGVHVDLPSPDVPQRRHPHDSSNRVRSAAESGGARVTRARTPPQAAERLVLRRRTPPSAPGWATRPRFSSTSGPGCSSWTRSPPSSRRCWATRSTRTATCS